MLEMPRPLKPAGVDRIEAEVGRELPRDLLRGRIVARIEHHGGFAAVGGVGHVPESRRVEHLHDPGPGGELRDALRAGLAVRADLDREVLVGPRRLRSIFRAGF
jgi:hypothetical protein